MYSTLLMTKISVILGLGCWMSFACYNNIVDRETNRSLLGNMLTMKLIKEQDILGMGLVKRAWINTKNIPLVLWIVVGMQVIISIALLLGATSLGLSIFKHEIYPIALNITNFGLLAFICLWLSFLCGGLWFGYWIYMSQVQTTHFILLILGLLTVFLINLL